MLTKRESQIMRLIALGYIEKEIANLLKISPCTVHVHSKRIREKTGSRNIADITRTWLLKYRHVSFLNSLRHEHA